MTVESGWCLFMPGLFGIRIPGRSAGARSEPPCTKEFRRQMVDLVRAGRIHQELAKEYGLSGQSLRNWAREAERPTPRPFCDDPNRVLPCPPAFIRAPCCLAPREGQPPSPTPIMPAAMGSTRRSVQRPWRSITAQLVVESRRSWTRWPARSERASNES
ncbi:transposase [Parafrankia sp. BMG5.11]|uniref:transposase n=1 Tax=Parafrankia sp. BMG5.11 TaxID=222540 RepID=UPI00103E2F4B|nr:hypothetical protein E0504_46635 [Parafrankia sp. BMG5.11]